MLEQRRTRAEQTREAAGTRIAKWAPPSTLPDPNPRPGWKHRWCAISVYNEIAPTINKRFAEGWEKCQASEYPEITAKIINTSKDGSIETGGLVLCRIDASLMEQRRDYYETQNRRELMGVKQETANVERENHRYGKIIDHTLDSSATENSARRLEFGDGR